MKRYIAVMVVVLALVELLGCAARQPAEPASKVLTEATAEKDAAPDTKTEQEKWARVPMVMVNGTLHLDTGYDSTAEGRCGTMDGEITSAVNCSEIPTVNDQSNFGTGHNYQYGMQNGTVELNLNGAWRIFATEAVREAMQFPEKVDLTEAQP